MRILFLGTSASIPTKRRSLPSIMIMREGEQLLFDCGEGAQRQMIEAGIGMRKRLRIFITHMHADHVLGLAGILMTLSLTGRKDPLEIYGPSGLELFIDCLRNIFNFSPLFNLIVHKVSKGTIYHGKGFRVDAFEVHHVTESYGYAVIEDPRPGKFDPKRAEYLGVPRGPLWKALQEGKSITINGRVVRPEDVMGPPRPSIKVVYTGDTAPSDEVVKVAEEADLLIHEATFDNSLEELAKEELHSTAAQAATIALKARVKRLVLTHISPRYDDVNPLLNQAKQIFENTLIAEDLMDLTVP
ncbi:MAG: ribonuclease Z [Candidatus Nezhaarchaeota archaeon]|nr:ribonuclease Z [Candidatus Nezhaarchaeota archaeon]MCX8142071.1 ribonuclease Z [Candidatus Nezhaarchaeota archaeon]MDW8050148.1 ribonuclease Z [Nitrososphaerota archaeon]